MASDVRRRQESPQAWQPVRRTLQYRALLATPGIRAFILWAVLFLSAVSYGYGNFYRDPGSIFFDPNRAYERWYSMWRERQAVDFLQKAEKSIKRADETGGAAVKFDLAGPGPLVCATFLTVKRKLEKQYIDASIGSLLHGLTQAERADLHLKVLFASTNPAAHPTWSQPWLRQLVDEVYTYNSTVTPDHFAKLHTLEAQGQAGVLEKGVTDYAMALRHCYESTSSPYIAIFEDDILLAEGWLVRSLLGLRTVEMKMAHQGRAEQWLYMRLFNQERSTGWASRTIGGNNEHWISLAASSAMCVVLVSLRRRSRVFRAHVDNWTLAVICLLAIPSFVVLFFKAGKASLVPPLAGVKEEPFGCCSQGMVFARDRVPGLVDYLIGSAAERPAQPTILRQQEVGKYDMITRDYSRTTGLARWALYPVQIQHVGIQSTVETHESESQAVWSMAFESLNPKSLGKSHAAMVKQFYGANATLAS